MGQKNWPVDDRPAVVILPLGPTWAADRRSYDVEVDMTVCLSGPLGELRAILRAFRP